MREVRIFLSGRITAISETGFKNSKKPHDFDFLILEETPNQPLLARQSCQWLQDFRIGNRVPREYKFGKRGHTWCRIVSLNGMGHSKTRHACASTSRRTSHAYAEACSNRPGCSQTVNSGGHCLRHISLEKSTGRTYDRFSNRMLQIRLWNLLGPCSESAILFRFALLQSS